MKYAILIILLCTGFTANAEAAAAMACLRPGNSVTGKVTAANVITTPKMVCVIGDPGEGDSTNITVVSYKNPADKLKMGATVTLKGKYSDTVGDKPGHDNLMLRDAEIVH